MSRKHLIRITCDVKDSLSPDEITPLQGSLKWLEETDYAKLKASLLKHGFSFPAFVWKSGKTNYCVDAHQRLSALALMREEGFEVEGGKIPVVYIQAKNKKQAMELILAAMSEYGSYNYETMYEFVEKGELEWGDIKGWADFPQINMGTMEKGWFDGDFKPEEPKGGGKTRFLHVCPACGHEFETGEGG